MNKIFLLVGLLIALNTSANDNVTLDVAGQNINISIENEVAYCAFQMDLTLPTGIRVTSVNKASRLNVDDGLTANFIVDSNMIGDNILRILCYNKENQAIKGMTGNLINLTLNGMVTEKIIATNIRFVKIGNLSETIIADAETQNPTFTPGDVDDDGTIDVQDVLRTAQLVLNSGYNIAADMDEDGIIDVQDVIKVAKVVLEQE